MHRNRLAVVQEIKQAFLDCYIARQLHAHGVTETRVHVQMYIVMSYFWCDQRALKNSQGSLVMGGYLTPFSCIFTVLLQDLAPCL